MGGDQWSLKSARSRERNKVRAPCDFIPSTFLLNGGSKQQVDGKYGKGGGRGGGVNVENAVIDWGVEQEMRNADEE